MNKFKLKGTSGRGLPETTLAFFLGFAAVSLCVPTAIQFKETMELTAVMMGLLVAIPSLSGVLLRILFGAWDDTTGGKKTISNLCIIHIIPNTKWGLPEEYTFIFKNEI